jgi:integrase
MRRGEILNLRWSDVDLDRGAIHLQTTKNGECRFIPLVRIALDLLKSRYAGQSVRFKRFL